MSRSQLRTPTQTVRKLKVDFGTGCDGAARPVRDPNALALARRHPEPLLDGSPFNGICDVDLVQDTSKVRGDEVQTKI